MRRFNQSRPGLYARVTARRNGDKGRPQNRAFRQKRRRMLNFQMWHDSGYAIPVKNPMNAKAKSVRVDLQKNATKRAFRVGNILTIGLEQLEISSIASAGGTAIDIQVKRGANNTKIAAHDSTDLILVDADEALLDDSSLSDKENERRRRDEGTAIKAFGESGQTVTSWLIDCGSSGSVSVDCETGNNAGFTDGGSVSYGSMTCTTTTDSCNQPA